MSEVDSQPSRGKTKKLSAAKKKLLEYKQRQEESQPTEEEQFVQDFDHLNGNGYSDNYLNDGTLDEQLSQISNHMNEVLNMSTPTDATELLQQLEQLRGTNLSLEAQLLAERRRAEERLRDEVTSARQHAQTHVQTIGVLVGEKSELQGALSQLQRVVKMKTEELTEMDGRLKANREQVSTLDRQLNEAQFAARKYEQLNVDLRAEMERVRADTARRSRERDTDSAQTSELRASLRSAEEQLKGLAAAHARLQGEHEMARLKLEQFATGGDDQERVRMLEQEREGTNALLRDYKAAVDRLNGEREQIIAHAQSQFEQQAAQHERELAEVTEDRNSLHRSLLESRHATATLQSELEESRVSTPASPAPELDNSRQQLALVEEERAKLLKEQDRLQTEAAESRSLVERQSERVRALESGSAAHRQLLAGVEGDRAALSRALAQNSQMKEQLLELETRFVSMSEEKAATELRLSDAVGRIQTYEEQQASAHEAEQQTDDVELDSVPSSVALSESWCQWEDDTLETLPTDVTPTASSSTQVDSTSSEERSTSPVFVEAKSIHQQNLERELEIAKRALANLTEQNSFLHQQLDESRASSRPMSPEATQKRQLIGDLTETVHRLETESSSAAQQTDALPADLAGVSTAIERLQEKFGSVMREKADLLDEKERLEHLVVQLQCETDTIGEYISLYQEQRATLKRQQLENGLHISRLLHDHQHQQKQLADMQRFVQQLAQAPADLTNGNGDGETVTVPKREELLHMLSTMTRSALSEPPPTSAPECSCCSGEIIDI